MLISSYCSVSVRTGEIAVPSPGGARVGRRTVQIGGEEGAQLLFRISGRQLIVFEPGSGAASPERLASIPDNPASGRARYPGCVDGA
jgi:hypothetical protein